MKLAFVSPPAVGLSVSLDGQQFDLVEHRTHTKQDGSETIFLVWLTGCADCGREFTTTSPWAQPPGNRRCDEHKKPGTRVRSVADRRSL